MKRTTATMEEATKQYATVIFNHETTTYKINYTNGYPLMPPEQSQEGFEIRIFGPLTLDKLKVLTDDALDDLGYDMPALFTSSSDDESENSD